MSDRVGCGGVKAIHRDSQVMTGEENLVVLHADFYSW